MATLQELFDLRNNSALRNRVCAACWNAAKTIFLEPEATPLHAERLAWAVGILRDNGEGVAVQQIFRAVSVLLQDTNGTATDINIQNAVDTVIDKFAAVEGA